MRRVILPSPEEIFGSRKIGLVGIVISVLVVLVLIVLSLSA